MTTDLETLVEMGFGRERAKLAVNQPGGLQGALEWLEKHQDESLEKVATDELKAETDPNVSLSQIM